jgi:hypothetical protein
MRFGGAAIEEEGDGCKWVLKKNEVVLEKRGGQVEGSPCSKGLFNRKGLIMRKYFP